MPKRILIVDDEEAIRRRLDVILSDIYLTKTVENGKEAIDILSNFQPDLILLDITMPVIDGIKTCKLIREDNLYRYTKIIMVSGEVSLDDRMNGYNAGADDYLTKPFDVGELLAKIDIMLRLKHAEEVDQILRDCFRLFSHESRTPLNGIMGFSSLILQDPKGEKVKEFAEAIYSSGNRLLSFSDKVTRFCDVKNYQNKCLVKCNLLNYFNGMSDNFKDVNDKQVKIVVNCPPNIEIQADWNLLSEAFKAIISNAIKFSPPNGLVNVDIEQQEKSVKIEIIDNGAGISSPALKRLFSPLLVGDIDHHVSGSGLSIATAKEIVDFHNGRIYGSNRSEGGAVFTIILPMSV